MAGRVKPASQYPKSKAIATVTTALSAVIYKVPEGKLKEALLVSVGIIAYLIYDTLVIIKRFVFREVTIWLSITLHERRMKKYVRELELELHAPETSPERVAEVKSEMKRYRDQLMHRRLESLER